MFSFDLEQRFIQKMNDRIRVAEELTGKGIAGLEGYWKKVGEIAGYRKAILDMREIVKHSLEEEEIDD